MSQIARVSSVALRPLSPDLSPEVAGWVTELRTLFGATGLSINRFVGLHPQIDKGTVSRYLNGKRVPRDRWFLDTLLIAAQEEAGRAPTPQVREHLVKLQLRALEAAHPHEYKVRRVSDELEIAVISQREAERYARSIEEQLAERIRQVQQLTATKRRLRAAWDRDRAQLHAERDRLHREIAALNQQLLMARERGAHAEHHCRQLETILERLDSQTAALPASEAQQTADQAIADALREADATLGRARREAEHLLDKARRQADIVVAEARHRAAALTTGDAKLTDPLWDAYHPSSQPPSSQPYPSYQSLSSGSPPEERNLLGLADPEHWSAP